MEVNNDGDGVDVEEEVEDLGDLAMLDRLSVHNDVEEEGMPPLMTRVIVMMRLTVQPIPSRITIQMIPTMTSICMPPNAYFPTYSCIFLVYASFIYIKLY